MKKTKDENKAKKTDRVDGQNMENTIQGRV